MSWGERSCINYGRCDREDCTMTTCNPRCEGYKSNGKEPDDMGMANPNNESKTNVLNNEQPVIVPSPPDKQFMKKRDFIILKGNLFKIQNVSPKKLYLKHAGMARKDIKDGVYCFQNKSEIEQAEKIKNKQQE